MPLLFLAELCPVLLAESSKVGPLMEAKTSEYRDGAKSGEKDRGGWKGPVLAGSAVAEAKESGK